MELTPIELDEIDQYWHAATHDGDDKLIKQGLSYLAKNIKGEVQLDELISLAVNRYEMVIPVHEQMKSMVIDHQGQLVPLGEGLAILASRSTSAKYLRHQNAGFRVLALSNINDRDKLIQFTTDPCVLVRSMLLANLWMISDPLDFDELGDLAMELLGSDPYSMVRDTISFTFQFRVAPSSDLWSERPDLFFRALEGKDCPCNLAASADFVDRFHQLTDEFALPVVDVELLERVRDNAPYFWATQPFPVAIEDYLMDDIVEYLQKPIPDQFSISHAGHGMNSYSLNFRYVLGEIAALVQVGWGGAYGDIKEDGAEWAEVLEELDCILELQPFGYQDGYRQRDYLILLSRFRGICHQSEESGPNRKAAPIVLKRSGDQWEKVPDLTSWDDVRNFFRNKWFAPDA